MVLWMTYTWPLTATGRCQRVRRCATWSSWFAQMRLTIDSSTTHSAPWISTRRIPSSQANDKPPQDHTSINVGGSVQRFGACGVVIWVLGNNTHYLANFSQSRLFRERPLMHGQKKWSKSLLFSLSNCKNHACSRLNTTRHATTLISQLPGWSVGFLVGYRLVCWLVGPSVGWLVSQLVSH